MKRFFENILKISLVAVLLASCEMEKEIDVDLPEYQPQLVVECYLVPGEPYKLTVLESTSFVERPEPILVPDAEVVITHNGQADTLVFSPFLDMNTNKFYTHRSKVRATGAPDDVYTLQVTDRRGRTVTGTTSPLPPVDVHEITWKFNDENEAYLLMRFQDDGSMKNFYRLLINHDSITGGKASDYLISDRLNNGKEISVGTSYKFDQNDTLTVSLFHVSEKYYNYLRSIDDARDANGNPFAQPSVIKSTVDGGLGVFTFLSFTRKQVIVR
ncbi:MAG: DUF4249 domain-containing protein [Hymenobacteraceae bacterium]|nr:DUF4249 domain-containing protein [Hymenobacteraceae bacterium]MDX5394589.1 DUF4249 domain-containing protein [Hymenobacteraceae bacterium]MDX5510617.1 DUF4249 domain-containing protein [Hymenobacteraceae bacterium]